MAEPSTKLPPPDYQEATPYARTTFHYMKDGEEESFTKHCIIVGQILSLKKDYEHKLGDPKSQRWYYKDELMSNTKTFQEYLIDATEDIDIKFYVCCRLCGDGVVSAVCNPTYSHSKHSCRRFGSKLPCVGFLRNGMSVCRSESNGKLLNVNLPRDHNRKIAGVDCNVL